VKRKTLKETKLEQYCNGFFDCLGMFEDEFRKHAMIEYHDRKAAGRSTLIEDSTCPITAAIWSVIEKAQKRASPVNHELNKLRASRYETN
jgi:hypothetical protein